MILLLPLTTIGTPAAWMMMIFILHLSLPTLFPGVVNLNEHYWVNSAKRRSLSMKSQLIGIAWREKID